jgi:hypothetical protein
MYRTRSGITLTVPHGDTFIFRLRAPEKVSAEDGKPRYTYRYKAQIRTYTGEWLADLNILPEETPGEYTVFTEEVLPVGFHYMDILIITSDRKTQMDVTQRTETVLIEVVASVTTEWTLDPSGQDRRFING